MSDKKIPLSAAARRLKCKPLNVLMHIKRELLIGEVVNGSWFIDVVSLESFMSSCEKAPEQDGCQSSCVHNCTNCGQG